MFQWLSLVYYLTGFLLMAKRILHFFLFWGIIFPCLAQEIKINDLEPRKDSVIIRYSLLDQSLERTYTVQLYALIESDTLLLQQLKGAGVGEKIKPGEYELTWNALAEMQRLNADVNFYITAVPSFFVDSPAEGEKALHTKPLTFQWFGGNSSEDSLNLVLYQYDTPVDTIVGVNEMSRYTWKVPKNLPPGEGYRVRFIGSEKTGIDDFSNTFIVKRNTSKWAIIAPAGAAVLGTLAYFLFIRKPLDEAPLVDDE